MKRLRVLTAALLLAVCLAACGTGTSADLPADLSADSSAAASSEPSTDLSAESQSPQSEENSEQRPVESMKINVQIGSSVFSATLADNAAAREFARMMRDAPVSVAMRDYAGFEKVGPLGRSLPADDRPTTTRAGDLVLYQGDQIVAFYGSNAWSYTPLGRIDDLTGWAEALGGGDLTVIFSLAGS